MMNTLRPPHCEGDDSNALGDSNVLSSDHDEQNLVTSKAIIEGLTPKELVEYNEKLRKRGIVYMSRVPPFMKPAKVKHLLGMHGMITKVGVVYCMELITYLADSLAGCKGSCLKGAA